jgi:hypothetical protein
MKTFFYGPITQNQGVIKDAIINTRDYDNRAMIQEVETMVNPLNASKDGTYTIDETITDFGF